jgi:hypothetical protein
VRSKFLCVTRSRKVQLFFLLTLLLLSFLRAWLSATASDCTECLTLATLQHDLALWSTIFVASALWMTQSQPIAWIAALIQLLLLLMVGMDLFILSEFGLRLSWRDVLKYGGEANEIVSYLRSRIATPSGMLGAGILSFLLAIWISHLATARAGGKRAVIQATAVAALCGALYALPTEAYHPLPWKYRNVVEINLPSGVDKPYSTAFKQRVLKDYQPPAQICETGRSLASNVILVIVESLSLYHSHDRLGIMNATPNLDRLAREGTSWSQFFSNGFTTDHGLIALLGGKTPLPAVNRYHSMEGFRGFENLPDSLPNRLGRDGYHTHFFTTGDLSFMAKDQWLKSIGFDAIEGSKHAFYDGAERFAFGAAHDGMLYERFLDWLSKEGPEGRPYLAVLETVTTHPPFRIPGTDRQDEQGAFRFADEQLAKFVERLRQRGFFEKGMLLITSDQRALTALRPEEAKIHGGAAPALLPFIALGSPFNGGGNVDTYAQMADVPASLDFLLTDRSCREDGSGNLFATPAHTPRCIMRPQGNERDILDVFCGREHLQVQFDGDRTRLVSGNYADADTLIRRINAERIKLGERQVEFTLIM